jgi:hypothetical protein
MMARPPQTVFHMPTSRPGMHLQQGDGWAAGGLAHAAGGRASLSYLPASCYGRPVVVEMSRTLMSVS